MDWLIKIFRNLTTEQIALFSAIITIIIFIINKRSELKYKKYEDKKTQYIKIVKLLGDIFEGLPKDKKGGIIPTKELKKQFFDTGASLLLYGSKKLYKQYIFFREYANNELLKKSKYYDEKDNIYIIAQILITIRREVGISHFNQIDLNESLAFFVNDIANNPILKKRESDVRYKIRMLKIEMFFFDRVELVFLNKLYNYVFRPIGGTIVAIIKYTILLPIIRLINNKKNQTPLQDNVDAK